MSQMSSNSASGFDLPLSLALAGLAIVTVGSWFTQLLAQFPPRTLGSSLTAVGFGLGSVAALIAVIIAVIKLVRCPPARTGRSLVLTAVGLLASFPAIVFGVATLVGA